MLRRLLIGIAVAVALLVPVERASAYDDICAFEGIMITSTPVPGEPTVLGPILTTDFVLFVTIGGCVKTSSFTSVGLTTARPGYLTTGTGVVTTTGQEYAFTGVGTVMELAGQVVGTLVFTPDVTVSSGGTRFLVTAAIALVN